MSDECKIYRGSKAICEAVGLPQKQIAAYVRDMGFPAFKVGSSRKWMAIHGDLVEWTKAQRDRYREK